MPLSFLKKHSKTVNLSFNDQKLRMVELAPGPKPVILQSFEQDIAPDIMKDGQIIDEPAFASLLETLVDQLHLKRRKVRFLIPDQLVAIRQVNIPLDVKDDELHAYLFLELGATIHLPFENPMFDCFPLSKNETHQNVLLVAAPENVIQVYKEQLEEVRLDPVVADVGPLSIYRACQYFHRVSENEHVMLLNFDETLLTISIFHEDIPIFTRPVKIEIDPYVETTSPSEELTILLLEDTFAEIEKVMNFYSYSLHQGEANVNRVFLSGDHSELELIHQHIKSRFQLQVTSLYDEANELFGEQQLSLGFATTIGLALKGVKLNANRD